MGAVPWGPTAVSALGVEVDLRGARREPPAERPHHPSLRHTATALGAGRLLTLYIYEHDAIVNGA